MGSERGEKKMKAEIYVSGDMEEGRRERAVDVWGGPSAGVLMTSQGTT